MRQLSIMLAVLLLLVSAVPAYAKYPWQRLPPIPNLPKAEHSAKAPVNGIQMWYAVFGHGKPVILVHGGLANANWWGLQVPFLAKHHKVIALDSRLMRSGYKTFSPTPKNFKLFHREMSHLWNTEPHFTSKQLHGIKVPTWIVDGDHDEIVKRENTDYIFSHIPGAEELILPGVSHFAFLQMSHSLQSV